MLNNSGLYSRFKELGYRGQEISLDDFKKLPYSTRLVMANYGLKARVNIPDREIKAQLGDVLEIIPAPFWATDHGKDDVYVRGLDGEAHPLLPIEYDLFELEEIPLFAKLR